MGYELTVNPGATKTKISYYEDDVLKAENEITSTLEDNAPYETVIDQYDFRLNDIGTWLEENNFEKDSFDAVVGRGGLLPPVNAGAYIVNDEIVDVLTHRPILDRKSVV